MYVSEFLASRDYQIIYILSGTDNKYSGFDDEENKYTDFVDFDNGDSKAMLIRILYEYFRIYNEDYFIVEEKKILDSKRIPLSSKIRADLPKIYPYYGAQGIVDYVDDYLFDGSYILVAEDGNNLKSLKEPITTWATGKFWVNNHAHILGEKEGYCLKYIYYLLTSMDLRGYVTGSAQPKFNQENLANIEIELPNETTQETIASVLTVLDEKILNNKCICSKLESMAKTLYDYWFTQFDFPNEGWHQVANPDKKSTKKCFVPHAQTAENNTEMGC